MNPWEENWSPAPKQAGNPWDEDWSAPAADKSSSDVKTAFVQGVKEIPGGITGLADIPAGLVGLNRPFSRAADAAGEVTGFQPSKWAKADEAKYSDAYKAQKAEIDAIDKDENSTAADYAKFYAQNPKYTGLNIVRSAPSMALGGAYAKGLKVIGGSAVARGAAGEGAVMAGQQMEGIDENVDPTKAAIASLATGGIGAAVGVAGGRAAQKMGLGDIDTLLAGGGRGAGPVDLVKRGITKRAAIGVGQEGAEELAQSLTEQGAKNLAEDKPFSEGMMRAGMEGTLAGGTLGGAMGAVSRGRAAQPEQDKSNQSDGTDQAAEVAQESVASAEQPAPVENPDMPAPPAVNPLIEQQKQAEEQEAQAQAAKEKRDAIISKVGGVVPIAGTNMSLFNGKPYHNDDPDGALDKQIAKLQESEDQKPELRKQVETAYVSAFNDMNKTAIAAGEKKTLNFANITSYAAKLIGAAQDPQDAASRIGAQIDLKVGPNAKVSPEVELLQDVYKRFTGTDHPSVARIEAAQQQEAKEKENAKPKPSVVQPAAKAAPAAAPTPAPVVKPAPTIVAKPVVKLRPAKPEPKPEPIANTPLVVNSVAQPTAVDTPKPQLVTVHRQGKEVQLPKETLAKDLAKALADPVKSPVINDVTGTAEGTTMNFREAAIASLTRQKKETTPKAVDNERKRIHKMLAGLGITESVVDKVSAMDVTDSPELAEISNDPESGVKIQNSPNASSTEEHLTAEQVRRQAEADKLMKEKEDVKSPEVATVAEQEVEKAILKKRVEDAERRKQQAIAEAARSPYAPEVREDWDDMADVLDGVTPKFDDLTNIEKAALVEYYVMYKNGDISYAEFESEQRDIARSQEKLNVTKAPYSPRLDSGVHKDDSAGTSASEEGRPSLPPPSDSVDTPSTESGSTPAKAPAVAVKKKRTVVKVEEKKSVLQTATEAFKKWFGKSVVVDETGNPLVVYHGTPNGGYDTFDPSKSGTRGTYESATLGIYFSSDKQYANTMARSTKETSPTVYPVYLSIQNPLRVFSTELTDLSQIEAVRKQAKEGGHDGIVDEYGNYVVFSAEQIKSAVGNNGQFSKDNPSITDAAQDFKDALADVGDILGKATRANLLPEQEKSLLGTLTKLVGAAIRMGYSSLEQATKFVLDSVKKAFGAKAVPVTPARVKTAYQASSFIERNVSKLPPSLQGSAFVAATNIKDLIQRGVMGLSFGHDLADMVAKTLPSAKKFFDAMDRKEAVKNRLEIEIDKIAAEAYKVPDRDALNRFLKTATRSQKWGYQPTWMDTVAIDPAQQAAYDKLSGHSKAVADKIFKHGFTSRQNMANTVRAEIESGFAEELKLASEADKDKIREKRKAEMRLFDTQFNSFAGPYAPLSRFGDFVMVAKSQARLDAEKNKDNAWLKKEGEKAEHYRVEFHDSLGAAKWSAKQLEGRYANTVGATKQAYAQGMSEAPWSALRRLKMMVNEHFVDSPEENKKAITQINQLLKDLYLSNLAETSARKHDLKRRDVEGASDDMLRAFASKGKADAHFMAALLHTGEVQDSLTEMRIEAHGKSSESAGRADRTNAFNEILRRHAGAMDYRPTPVQDKILMLNSVWMLLTKPAYYLQNATQPFMMSLPVMAGRSGSYTKAAGALTQAYKDLADGFGKDSVVGGFLSGDFNIDAMPIKQDEKQALKKLLELGILDIGINMDMGYWESRGGIGQGMVDVTHKLTTLVKQVEVMNRVSTALAAYRLAGGGIKGIEEAKHIVRTTHGNYSTFNAPSLLNKVPKLVVQFRKFQLIQLALMSRLVHQSFKGETKEAKAAARASLGYTLGHYGVMAGALGMPAMSVVGMALAAMFGDDEEPEDFELMARKFIDNEEVADILLKGAPTLAGMDLSGTLGAASMTSILPFTDIKLDSKKGFGETMLGLMGPAIGGTAPRIADGIGFMGKGDIYKGFEKMLPNGVANAMKAYREASEGMSNKHGDMTLSPDEISLWDTMLTALSIRTQTAAKTQFVQGNKIEFENFYKERTGEIKHRYIKAWKEGDGDIMADMREQWQDVQMSRSQNGFPRQPMSDLVKAPREQMKRERNTSDGVQYQKGSRRFVQEAAAL